MFNTFTGNPVLNDAGQTAYQAFLQTNPGVVDTTNDNGIWITGTNGQSLLVAREGDSLAGRTISGLDFSDRSGGSDGRGRGLNNFSQLAYQAFFTNGDEGLFLFTPEIHWTSAATGSWDSAANWTIGQLPGDPHDVFIDPAVSQTVTGPTGNATVTNLTIGGNNGIATLNLNGGTITSPSDVVITSTGVLTGDGVINGNVTNNGTVTADNVTITGTLTNNNLIRGTGRINGQLSNRPTGEVRIAAGESLRFTGSSNSNLGRIEAIGSAIAPAEIEFDGVVTNEEAAGEIFARNALLRFNGGLTNQSSFSISFGTTDIFGNVDNVDPGTIIISGNSNATFYDDVFNESGANFRTSAGSTVVFFGDVSGAGTFAGTGTVFFEGTFSPGSSPAEVSFGGDLTFGSSATLEIELGGLIAGSEFDTLDIAGAATLAGVLDISLINGFTPTAGDTFEIITAASVVDTFDIENLPDLGGLVWNVNYDATNVLLEVVSPFSADFDNDGDVDGDDLAQWQGDFGANGNSDADADGDSDGHDFLTWQRQFGGGGGMPLAAAATVPEPSSFCMLLMGLIVVSTMKRQGKRY